jgi:hypothetical protein
VSQTGGPVEDTALRGWRRRCSPLSSGLAAVLQRLPCCGVSRRCEPRARPARQQPRRRRPRNLPTPSRRQPPLTTTTHHHSPPLAADNLGMAYQKCAQKAQARSRTKREAALSKLTMPDGRWPIFSKAARKKISAEVLDKIRCGAAGGWGWWWWWWW